MSFLHFESSFHEYCWVSFKNIQIIKNFANKKNTSLLLLNSSFPVAWSASRSLSCLRCSLSFISFRNEVKIRSLIFKEKKVHDNSRKVVPSFVNIFQVGINFCIWHLEEVSFNIFSNYSSNSMVENDKVSPWTKLQKVEKFSIRNETFITSLPFSKNQGKNMLKKK